MNNIRKMVTEHEQRMEQLRRSTLERDRLNNEINELNSQNNPNKNERMTSNLPISADAQKSIKAFFYDFCKYMEENYCATPTSLCSIGTASAQPHDSSATVVTSNISSLGTLQRLPRHTRHDSHRPCILRSRQHGERTRTVQMDRRGCQSQRLPPSPTPTVSPKMPTTK